MTKRVLIITYYWPPGGGAGVQRWLKFTKYLHLYGWTPVIFTPENGEMPVLDESLMADVLPGTEVIRLPIWEPYSVYKKFVGARKGEKINTGFLTESKKPGLAQRISVWIRGNFFIPDARRFWIRPATSFLKAYLKDHPVDAIVSTGPPHSMHLIAQKIARELQLPWLADFRDPWTNIDYYKDLMLTKASDRKHHELEAGVIREAGAVVVIGDTMKQEFESRYGRTIDVITNGFDESDVPEEPLSKTPAFILAHVGTLVRTRNPLALWKILKAMMTKDPQFASDLQIRLTGKVDVSVRESLGDAGLLPKTTFTEYLPHDRVVAEQRQATVLLLLLNDTPNARGILTGKLFEYMASGRPVLCAGPADGDAAAILNDTGSGRCFNFTDEAGMSEYIRIQYENWKKGVVAGSNADISRYSRRHLTAKLAGVLDRITS